jgi:hypothetical protein
MEKAASTGNYFESAIYDGLQLAYKVTANSLYGQVESRKDYLWKLTSNVYRVKSYQVDFKELFDKWTKVDLLEGVVLKRKNARLEIGATESNNTNSQIKSRKKSKNYKF